MSDHILVNIGVNFFGVAVSLIIFLYLLLGENRKIRLNRLFAHIVLCNMLILTVDAISWSFDGTSGQLGLVITRTVSFVGYISMYMIIGAFTYYLKAYLLEKIDVVNSLFNVALGMCAFAMLTVILSQFGGLYYYFDETNLYHRGELYWLSQVLLFFLLLLNMAIVFVHRKALIRKETVAFLFYLLLPSLLNILHIVYYNLSWSCVGSTLAVVVIYAGIQHEQASRLALQALELSEGKIALMLSQIQPHFLYNALNTIGDLCVTDPEEAQNTVFEFADYLRMNMDSLTVTGLVPFEKELDHVKTYLALEQKRFMNRLCVEYDIQAHRFELPPLTVQPIVENAVLHGITVRRSMGTVLIRTEETPQGVKITVTDDGVGFDPAGPPKVGGERREERSHVGLDNVRRRVESMCGGSMTVESASGVGTTVTIMIP